MNSTFSSFNKDVRFADLVESVQHCDLCSRLCDRRRVLSKANGNVNAKVLFIAEAPGRLGADRTGVPLHGDRTGDNFESLLGNIGWRREDLFITNAVLCNPKEDSGNNGTPTQEEVANCAAYLEMVIALVGPDVIATLGATALAALDAITSHGLQLRDSIGQMTPWRNTLLFPLYHPGPRAMIHRALPKQRADFMQLAKVVHPVTGLVTRKKKRQSPPRLFPAGLSPMQQIARAFLELGGQMTYFKMTKLMYWVDLLSIKRLGYATGCPIYLRQVDGPWPPELDRALEAMKGHEVRRFFVRRMPMVAPGPSPRSEIHLDDSVLEIVSEVYRTYGSMSNAQIKTAVYRSAPMQFILEEEKVGKNMINKPVLYKNRTARELSVANP